MRYFSKNYSIVLFCVVLCGVALGNSRQQAGEKLNSKSTLAIKDVCAWPNLTKMKDGSIVATIFNQPSHGQCEGTVECWQTRNEGETWEYLGTPIKNKCKTNRMNVAAGLAKNGDFVIVVSGWKYRKGGGLTDNDWRAAILEPVVCRSKDGGETWAVCESFPKSDGTTPFIPFGDILQDDDSLVLSAYTVDFSVKPNVNRSFFFRSFDDGRTWKKESQIAENCNETSLVKIKEAGVWSKWLAAARNGSTTLELYKSDNDGQTWRFGKMVTELKRGPGHFLILSDGRLLLSYGNRVTNECGVAVRVSNDKGCTWSDPIQIADMKTWDGGYPSSVELDDGRILTVYYAKQSLHYDNYHMVSAVWSLSECAAVNLMDVKLEVEPKVVRSGEMFTVKASCGSDIAEVKYSLTTPYDVSEKEAPSGFLYDARMRKCFRTEGEKTGYFKIKTDGWDSGLYHLTLMAEDQVHHTYRDFAVKVIEDEPILKVTVLKDGMAIWGRKEKALINFIKLDDGTILANPFSSSDGGWTWKKDRAFIGYTGCQLDNGEVVLLGGVKEYAKKDDGLFRLLMHQSTDECKNADSSKAILSVPKFISGYAHAPYSIPLLYRSVVSMPDGKLLATMYGRFKGDNIPWNWHGVQQAMKTRSFVVQSTDSGKSWRYLSTLAHGTKSGMEGYNETAMIRLKNGTLLAVVRSGDNAHSGCEDNQLYKVVSSDGGKTWSKPAPLGVEGVSPDLCQMSNGVLVCSYGRPGVNLMFSLDDGNTWTGHTCIHPARYKCYTAVCEGNPGQLILNYIIDDLINDAGDTKRGDRFSILSVEKAEKRR